MNDYSTSSQIVNIYDNPAKVSTVAPNCWSVANAFAPNTLSWLQGIQVNEQNEFSVSRPHHRLLLKPGPDHEKLQQIGLDIIPELSKLTGIDLNLMIVKFWLDLPGFACQPHSDAADIIVTYQVYVDVCQATGDPCHGVEFLHVEPGYEIPILPNHGYINLNTDLKPHRVLPGGGTRTSVVFQYNRV